MEPEQLLKVGGWQFFYAKITKAGRINVPKLTMALLQSKNESLAGCIVEVTFEPT